MFNQFDCDSFVNYQREQYWSVKIGIVFIGLWCNGNTTVFGAVVPGSNPGSPTIIPFSLFLIVYIYLISYTVRENSVVFLRSLLNVVNNSSNWLK